MNPTMLVDLVAALLVVIERQNELVRRSEVCLRMIDVMKDVDKETIDLLVAVHERVTNLEGELHDRGGEVEAGRETATSRSHLRRGRRRRLSARAR